MYTKLFSQKKKLFFILDELSLKNKKDIDKIEDFIIFNSKFFIDTKKKLDKYQKSFMKKFSKCKLCLKLLKINKLKVSFVIELFK